MEQPNPGLVWDMFTAHQRSSAIKAAIELNLFDQLTDGLVTSADIAHKIGVPERGIRILADYLTIQGLILKADGKYQHSSTSATFLDSKSPANMAPMLPFIMTGKIVEASQRLTQTIRNGYTALEVPLAGEEVNEWVQFAQSMQPMMGAASQFIAEQVVRDGQPSKVLDVAASHGMFGIAVARRAPGCEIVALDFPTVLEVTAANAKAAGVPITLLPGSAFTADLGTGYDAILVTNLFHHFSIEENIALMKRFQAALRPGGKMVILEMVPNDDRVTPPQAASFSLMMLANTTSGDAFTMSEYNRMLDASGFAARELLDVPMSPQQLIVATR